MERDEIEDSEPLEARGWDRRGIPHFLQPHLFIPRGRVELRAHLPDVYESLLTAGAWDVDVRKKLPGDVEPRDEELQYLAVRRPLIEWGLRRAVLQETSITVRSGSTVRGLRLTGERVDGVDVDGTTVEADLVVDALGRRSPTGAWLEKCGARPDDRAVTDCGVIYYSRYYRTKDGFELPDGPWVLSPRGDLGYLAYASFPGDNGTFAGLLSVPTGVPEWRAFGHAEIFEAAIARIPALRLDAPPDHSRLLVRRERQGWDPRTKSRQSEAAGEALREEALNGPTIAPAQARSTWGRAARWPTSTSVRRLARAATVARVAPMEGPRREGPAQREGPGGGGAIGDRTRAGVRPSRSRRTDPQGAWERVRASATRGPHVAPSSPRPSWRSGRGPPRRR